MFGYLKWKDVASSFKVQNEEIGETDTLSFCFFVWVWFVVWVWFFFWLVGFFVLFVVFDRFCLLVKIVVTIYYELLFLLILVL